MVSEGVYLTDAGRAAANTPETPLTTEELQQRVLARLDGPGEEAHRAADTSVSGRDERHRILRGRRLPA